MGKLIAIIGAGNGGQAFAAYLSLKGHDIKLFDVMQDTVDKLNELGGVDIEGNSDYTGFGKILMASTDIGKVMEGAEIVMIVLPSIYHKDIAEKMAPHLKDGQYVILNPNACFGAVEFHKVLQDCHCTANIKLASTSTLLFACRADKVGHVMVSGQKKSYSAAAFPSKDNEVFAEEFKDILPQLIFEDDIIRVSLDNLNAFVHPAPTLLNTGRIEGGVDFQYYLDFTPSQGKFVEALDKERMALAEAFGLKIRTIVDEYKELYETSGDTVYDVMRNCAGYHGIKGQKSLRTRYLQEDIPYSLEAVKALGEIAGVPTPCVNAVIVIARHILEDLPEGRTAKNLGIEGMSKEEFVKFCRG